MYYRNVCIGEVLCLGEMSALERSLYCRDVCFGENVCIRKRYILLERCLYWEMSVLEGCVY